MYDPIRPQTALCRRCVHGVWAYKGWACYYLVRTGRRRPCPPGRGCRAWEAREEGARRPAFGFVDFPDSEGLLTGEEKGGETAEQLLGLAGLRRRIPGEE